MNKESNVDSVRVQIIDLLHSTKRDGIGDMIGWLADEGFFESPASTRFHGAYQGGLAEHSLGVYDWLARLSARFMTNDTTPSSGQIQLPVSQENLIIAGLLHDVCKLGAYLGSEPPYKWNRAQPKGHALLSLIRIAKYIELEPIEELMIKFHMGVYGLFEFELGKGEYPLRSAKIDATGHVLSKEERYGKSLANAWYHNPMVKLMYFCDELESFNR